MGIDRRSQGESGRGRLPPEALCDVIWQRLLGLQLLLTSAPVSVPCRTDSCRLLSIEC
jgi:hypothetical protein